MIGHWKCKISRCCGHGGMQGSVRKLHRGDLEAPLSSARSIIILYGRTYVTRQEQRGRRGAGSRTLPAVDYDSRSFSVGPNRPTDRLTDSLTYLELKRRNGDEK